jgi:small subunit ribosomal protein S15
MARAYSGRKGAASSTRPSVRKSPAWQKYGAEEVEALVTKLAKEGKTSSQIGMHLRDVYGIPDIKATAKKSVIKILKEKKLMPKLPEDLASQLRRIVSLTKHMEKNRQDMSAKRGIQLTEAKIFKMMKFYKSNGTLPSEWKYERENAQLLLK